MGLVANTTCPHFPFMLAVTVLTSDGATLSPAARLRLDNRAAVEDERIKKSFMPNRLTLPRAKAANESSSMHTRWMTSWMLPKTATRR